MARKPKPKPPQDVNQNAFRVIQEAAARAEEPPNRPLKSVKSAADTNARRPR